MRIAFLSPYGVLSQESGLVFLLGNYLRRIYPDIVQLRCNGLFSVCDRDAEKGWQRGFQTCFRCMAEQREFSQWSGLTTEDLSRYLEPADIERSRRFVTTLPTDQLQWAQFEGQNLFSLALGSWQNRFNVSRPDLNNSLHEQMIRRFMLSAARVFVAARRFRGRFAPDLIVASGGNDFIARGFAAEAATSGGGLVRCSWDVSRRAILVSHPHRDAVMPCELLLDGLVDMRSDPATWSPMLLGIVEELLLFLGITEAPAHAVAAR